MKNEINGYSITSSMRNDDVSILHCWFNEFVITWFNKTIVLSKHIFNCPTTIIYVALNTAREANIVISHHENFKVHQISKSFFVQSHNSFKYKNWLSIKLCKCFWGPNDKIFMKHANKLTFYVFRNHSMEF